jgi:hypothetical protein
MAGLVAGIILGLFSIVEMTGSEHQNEFDDNLIYNHNNYEMFQGDFIRCDHIYNDSLYAGISERTQYCFTA